MQTKCANCGNSIWLNKDDYDILCCYKCKKEYFGDYFPFTFEEAKILDLFHNYGNEASSIFADDHGSWQNGFFLSRKAMDLYLSEKNPKVREEMKKIGKGFLWSFESDLEHYKNRIKNEKQQGELQNG